MFLEAIAACAACYLVGRRLRAHVRARRRWVSVPREWMWITAVHEAAHAWAGWRVPVVRRVRAVTIMPLDRTLAGYTRFRYANPAPKSREEKVMLGKIHLAGYAAEAALLGVPDAHHGSEPDIMNALARALSIENTFSPELNRAAVGQLLREWTEGRIGIREIATIHLIYERTGTWFYELVGEMLVPAERVRILKLARELMRRRTLRHRHLLRILGPRPKF